MLSENELYHQLKQNQPQAYGMFYRQVHGLCLPYSLNKGNSHEEAEDILHECLAIFIHNIRSGVFQFSEGVKLSTYFYGIFKNQCLKQYEKKTKKKRNKPTNLSIIRR